ncbi:hypothetical protein [Dongia deserti]|uniref:hypothetical protein n=1 Tax=Dongia deserti TaxID=2268030 RepID=UPI000E65E2CC|nr:hypothetical protein [Dongia deserti]
MTITEIHVLLIAGLAFLSIAALLVTAPTLEAGINRLKLVMNTVGIIIVVACSVGGIALFVWGFHTGEKGYIYFSFLPLAAAVGTWNAITRRHRTWWGILGANDSSERSRAFWKETFNLWRGRDPDHDPAGQRFRWTPGDKGGGNLSFSINLGGSGAKLASLLQLGAHRLSTDLVSVFPNVLQFAVVLDERAQAERSYLDLARQELTVRRKDGAPIAVRAASDLPFLTITPEATRPDSTHVLIIGLRADELRVGPFTGTISIETDHPDQPTITVPVIGQVTRER